MNSREHSDMPPATSYPSPNAAQMAQGSMPYYGNRQLTADELLSAELSRETSGPGLNDGSSNGVHHGQSMVMGSSNPGFFSGLVRCDASSESGVETCSNCRRLGVACQFSRVPMKRGPSKGYIKELAERLHTLESQMQPAMVHPDMQYQAMNEVSPPRPYQEFSPPMDAGSIGRKRTYSVFEGLPAGLPNTSYSQPQFNPRGSQNAFDAGETSTDPMNSLVMGNTAPKPGNLFWSTNEHEIPHGLDIPDVPKHGIEEDMTPLDVDGGALNAYYAKIHTIFPILPHSKDRLLEILHQCSREVQEVFLYALYTVTRTNLDRVLSTFERVTSFDNAQDLLLYYTRQPALVRPTAVNLVWLQATLLMILDCDSRGPENIVLKDGVPKHSLIQSATKLGSDMAKSLDQLKAKRSSDADVDSDANLVRRSWVSLAILARWYAISVADLSVLVNQEIGGREDERVLGSVTAGIGAYSSFLVEMVTLAAMEHNVCQSNTGLGRMIGANLVASLERLGQIEDLRKPYDAAEETPSHGFFESLQNQLYWTVRLLIKRHIFVYSPYEIIYCAVEVINELHKATMESRPATPFDLHSLALASMTLLEATVLPEHTNECWDTLRKVEEILDRRAKVSAEATEFENIYATPGWDSKIRIFIDWRRSRAQEPQHQESSVNKTSSTAPPVMGPNEQRSLQHLADLAVGAEGSVAASSSSPPPLASTENNVNTTSPHLASSSAHQASRVVVDFTLLTKEGYLNVFSGLIYRRTR
ncbi:hypothetical protein KXV47_006713 [Aspergillus fumigatus]|nr:hypothetical protein KXV47_006713 [Aspergillus fumigatus]